MIDDLKKANELVEAVLRDIPISRASDKKLIVEVWKRQGLSLSKEQEDAILGPCLTPESITRCRRKMQEDGFYKPSPEIEKQRDAEENRLHDLFSRNRKLF